MTKPTPRPDGTCTACQGGWLCRYHQEETQARWQRRQDAAANAASAARIAELARIAARFEFESDQFQTATEKAAEYLETGRIAPRF
jgi:hypothetical protein